jgi:hypothetical protein
VNTVSASGGGGTTDWVYHYTNIIDDKARYSDKTVATSQVEKDAHQAAISSFWNGPNNYVEWGMGGTGEIENNYTGMDIITINSIAPGKGGTGYMGISPNQQASGDDHNGPQAYPRWTISRVFGEDYTETRPYYDTILELRDEYGKYERDLYPRLVGTYQIYGSQWIPRFGPIALAGNPGDPGITTSGGSGGAKGTQVVYGSDQDTFTRYDWGGFFTGVNAFNQGLPSAGAGGSVVYLYANTHNSISGLRIKMVNNETGMIKSGGGGGSGGGTAADGLSGGNLGKPGKWFTGAGAVHNARTSPTTAASAGFPTDISDPHYAWRDYTIRGEPGKLVWWNSSNVTSNYTIENKSKTASCAIEGMDYNPGIAGWDYVSYLPDINVAVIRAAGFPLQFQYWVTAGLRLWGRKLGDDGYTVYTTINEKTFEEYLTAIGAVVITP